MLLQYSLIVLLSSITSCFGQSGTPTETGVGELGILAIIPTATGQIGINPVDIPDPESFSAPIGIDTQYLTETVADGKTSTKWIGVGADFGIATITTAGADGLPQETTIPKGFNVVVNAEGKVEITLSQLIKDQLAEIAPLVPTCPSTVRRDWDPKSHRHVEKRAADIDCIQKRTVMFTNEFRKRAFMVPQMMNLNEDIAIASGNDAFQLSRINRMMAFTPEGVVSSALAGSEASLDSFLVAVESAASGVMASFAFFIGAVDILEDLWKLKADPQPMPFFKSKTDTEEESCPKLKLACAGQRCRGQAGVCTGEWKGCKCGTSSVMVGDVFLYDNDWAVVQQIIKDFDIDSDPSDTKDIPDPTCSSTSGDENNLANMETDFWKELLDKVCDDNSKLSSSFDKTMKASDLGLDSYENWTFDFSLQTSGDEECTGYSCADVFGKFSQCSYDSHTKYKTGELNLDCGTVKYAMNEPDEEAPEEKPKTALKMQNDKCYGRDEFGDHGDIDEYWVRWYSGWACGGTALNTIKAGQPDTFINTYTTNNDVPYQYNVYWKDGCELETGETEMYASNPLNEKNPGHTKCQEILIDDYKRCNNGGVGGSIEAGCLVYEFKAEKQ
ncbi:hypothetical protein AUP68_16495 [Ilyonectria robusta]